jgi:transketolase
MPEFTFNTLTLEYTLSPDWDNGWRTGGTLEEVLDEAHLTEFWILEGIKKFTSHREIRLKKLRDSLIF